MLCRTIELHVPTRRRKLICACVGFVILVALILVITTCGGGSGGGGTSPSATSYPLPSAGPTGPFFGINTNVLSDPWPGTLIPVSSWRSLGSSVKWADINTGPGSYDFSKIDQLIAKAKASNTDILFTTYATPSWASSRGVNCSGFGNPSGCLGPPNTACAFQQQNGPGICDPPSDVACDGTGTDQMFKTFVSALVQHVGPGTIKYWEMWNEPNVPDEWNADADCPNTAKAGDLILARMARDLRATVLALDPNAKFTTPAVVVRDAVSWLPRYLSSTDGGASADIVAFHGYVQTGACPSDCPIPESIGPQIAQLISQLPASEQAKPLFDTEGSWGATSDQNGNRASTIADPDQQASFLARYYLLQMSKHTAKFYWWNWDISQEGGLFDSSAGSLSMAARAYVQIVRWTDGGRSTVAPCAANGTIWSCTVTSPTGAVAEAIWDTSQTCDAGVCSTRSVSTPPQFNAYLDLSGDLNTVSGSAPIGLKPILLITQ